MMRFRAVLLANLVVTSVAFAGARYDASSGTLPAAPFIYSGDGTNPSPFVAGGALHENTTGGNQYWFVLDSSVDFSAHIVVEARLHIVSSNEVPNVGTGTREGYYLGLNDSIHTMEYAIGLADTGFNINSILVPNQPLTPYPFPVTDTFHTYRVVIDNFRASFYIDGQLVAGNIVPNSLTLPLGRVLFGAGSGASRSVTELKTFCYGNTVSSAAARRPTCPSGPNVKVAQGVGAVINMTLTLSTTAA